MTSWLFLEYVAGGHTDLQMFHVNTLTDVRNRNEIPDPYFRPHVDVIRDEFKLMNNNALVYSRIKI